MRRRPVVGGGFLGCIVAAIAVSAALAEEVADGHPETGVQVDFAQDVFPLLRRSCHSCHGEEAAEAGLRLDDRRRAFEGGDSGKILIPGKAAGSRFLAVVSGADEELGIMPPEGEGTPLTSGEIDLLRRWINQGADWPERAARPATATDHWSFQPLVRPALPAVTDTTWPRNAIDHFVLARLEKEGIAPAATASRETLARRLSLDLLGLPPSPDDLRQFLADHRPGAYERLVERLLASPHYGERWARHWLDLARYADTDGYEKDRPRPHAWRYREWVIAALNCDTPFDQFTVAQIAGDMLDDATPVHFTAAGFHRNTLHNTEGGIDPEEDRVKKTVDRTNTTGSIWLGMTVGCAQCHSHKYDPLTQREYYALFAFFNNIDEKDVALPGEPSDSDKDNAKARSVSQRSEPRETKVLVRGDFLNPGEVVPACTPAILPPIQARQVDADRLDFANWIVDPANPLPARVTVNRIWARFFGRGIVRTVDDFGKQGDPPSHPKLLDWLAVEFQDGWSLKVIQRLIVTSATYRQSSDVRHELVSTDPENTLLARQSRLRLEGEIIRDCALAASGLLDPRLGGPSVRPPQASGHSKLTYANSAKWAVSAGGDAYRRGLYTFFQRTSPYPMLMTFDGPDSNTCCPQRNVSNTPLQALTLWNDPAFVECAQALGVHVFHNIPGDEPGAAAQRATHFFRLLLAREPTADELQEVLALYNSYLALASSDPQSVEQIVAGSPLAADGDPAAMAAWILVGRTLLNLDEFVTRD